MTKMELQEHLQVVIKITDINSWHGISKESINEFLVEPIKTEFVNASNSQIKKYWVILDELPTSPHNGYQIIYDEEEGIFGIATKNAINFKDLGMVIGFYGSFIDAINNM